jgi:hypothetical protein
MTRRSVLQSTSAIAALALTGSLAAEPAGVPPATVYELRVYHLNPGKLPLILARFRDHERAIFTRLGMTNVAFFTPIQPPELDDRANAFAPETLVYILRHKSLAAARASWVAFKVDPEWVALKAETEKDGAFVAKSENTFLKLTDFSAAI